jgi:hypothetical protein
MLRAVCRVGYPAGEQPAERTPVLKLTPRSMPGIPPRDARGAVSGG